jgi:outer membrane protein OmpA-like peptidoglycan-associated protein
VRRAALARVVARAALLLLSVTLSVPSAVAQTDAADNPLPPGTKSRVLQLKATMLPLKGKVLPLKANVLPLKATVLAMGGRTETLQGALKDLGAKVTKQEIRIDLAADVLFDFDKAVLRPEAGPALEKVAAVLNSYPKATIVIEGHTDGKGDDQYNQKLSERRAEAVRLWLVAHKVTTPMTSRGWGRTKPVAPNSKSDGSDDPVGRQKNRRVEITVKTP